MPRLPCELSSCHFFCTDDGAPGLINEGQKAATKDLPRSGFSQPMRHQRLRTQGEQGLLLTLLLLIRLFVVVRVGRGLRLLAGLLIVAALLVLSGLVVLHGH